MDLAISRDAVITGIEDTFNAIALELYRHPSVRFYLSQALYDLVVVRSPTPPLLRSGPPPQHPPHQPIRPRRPPGVARVPAGWHHLHAINSETEVTIPIRTVKTIPRIIRDQYLPPHNPADNPRRVSRRTVPNIVRSNTTGVDGRNVSNPSGFGSAGVVGRRSGFWSSFSVASFPGAKPVDEIRRAAWLSSPICTKRCT